MEDIQRDLEKELSRTTVQKTGKRKNNWTLLMVSDDGEVRKSGRILTRVKIYRNFLLVSLVLAGVLSLYSWDTFQENLVVEKKVKELLVENRNLKERNDLLTAELVMVEEKSGMGSSDEFLYGNDGSGPGGGVGSGGAGAVLAKKVVEPSDGSGIVKKESKSIIKENKSNVRVSVEKFSAAKVSPKKQLRVQFVIRNKTPGSAVISGRIFVRLKGDGDVGLTEPGSFFKNGLPVDPKKGQLFSIARYKTVFFNFKNVKRQDMFDSAEIFVFSVKGELIFNETISMALDGGGSV